MSQVTPDAIMQLGLGFWGSKTLLSAVELGVFTELAGAGPLDGEALRERLGLHARSARDFFDALVALGMLEREDGRYAQHAGHRRSSSTAAKPSYMGGMLEMAERPSLRVLGLAHRGAAHRRAAERGEERRGLLRRALRRPRAARAVRERHDRHQRRGGARASRRSSRGEDHKTFIDVGCAEGAVPVQVALAHDAPHRRRIRPARRSLRSSRSYVAGFGLGDRLRFHRRRLLRRAAARGRRAGDGAHPPRLGPRREEGAAREGL